MFVTVILPASDPEPKASPIPLTAGEAGGTSVDNPIVEDVAGEED